MIDRMFDPALFCGVIFYGMVQKGLNCVHFIFTCKEKRHESQRHERITLP